MFRTILTPLDGSTFGEWALPVALNIARRSAADLRLLHVVPPPATLYSENALFIEDSDLESYVREHQAAPPSLYYLAPKRQASQGAGEAGGGAGL